jgi:hypothetical protein
MSDNPELDPQSEWAVGAYTDADTTLRSYVATIGELRAAKSFASRHLESHEIRRGDVALVVGDVHEAVQIVPFRDVLGETGAIIASASPGAFGGSQVQLYAEDFDVAVVVGMDSAMADALDDTTIERLLKRPTMVLARPGADGALRARGLDTRRFAFVGPMVAIECSEHTGSHFDGRAWKVDDSGDRLVVSSRLNQASADGIVTDARGTVDPAYCACGSDDPRIVFAT